MTATLSTTESSMRIDDDFFSVAMTMPFVANRMVGGYLGCQTKTMHL